MYNAVTREMEAELVPCCRKYGIRIVIYNPLACVLMLQSLTHVIQNSYVYMQRWVLREKVAAPNAEAPQGGRFDPNSRMGAMYRARYLKGGYFEALNYLKLIAVSLSYPHIYLALTVFYCRRSVTSA